MRFCKQQDGYSCGAIAALNIDKIRGRRVCYHDLQKYRDLVGCKKHGTYIHNISRVFGRASRRSWEGTKKFLLDGNCILIFTNKSQGHFYLMAVDQNDCAIVINRHWGEHYPSTVQVTPQAAARLLRCAERTWYINKEQGDQNV